MPQIANQDYNFIDFNVLPYYEGVERLYRAYLNGTAFDCIVKEGNGVTKIVAFQEGGGGETVTLRFNPGLIFERNYVLKAPLAAENSDYLMFKGIDRIYIVSADGFKLKPVVQDGVLTGVEVTTEKVKNNALAQYFKDWMIGQPVTQK